MSNHPFKRGVVKENDAAKARSRVEFVDEDGVTSHWLAWGAPAAGGSKIYAAPDIGSQVGCLLDRHGEDGMIVAALYSDKDPPPATNDKQVVHELEGGLTLHYDRGAGSLTLRLPAGLTIEAGAITVKGPVTIEGAALTHNGKNVGSDHGHVSAPTGPPGPPI